MRPCSFRCPLFIATHFCFCMLYISFIILFETLFFFSFSCGRYGGVSFQVPVLYGRVNSWTCLSLLASHVFCYSMPYFVFHLLPILFYLSSMIFLFPVFIAFFSLLSFFFYCLYILSLSSTSTSIINQTPHNFADIPISSVFLSPLHQNKCQLFERIQPVD